MAPFPSELHSDHNFETIPNHDSISGHEYRELLDNSPSYQDSGLTPEPSFAFARPRIRAESLPKFLLRSFSIVFCAILTRLCCIHSLIVSFLSELQSNRTTRLRGERPLGYTHIDWTPRDTRPIRDGRDDHHAPPPPYSRFPTTTAAHTIPTAPDSLPRGPAHRQCALPPRPPHARQPPPRHLRDMYEAMQRGEFVPAVIVEPEPEQPTLPVDSNGRRRRRRYEEEDDEDSDEEDRRSAKRSRISWGPLDFLRPWV
ncbi:hypothetical protein B0H13DRAFT_1904888 [Mycena leptocephala]|nr:hypothetical protein B0H13DRAFT_1904888 [Mycena leptocephala]